MATNDPADKWWEHLPVWVPEDMLAWLRRFDGKSVSPAWRRWLTDPRLRGVWEWHTRVRHKAKVANSALGLCLAIKGALVLPGKPGNLPAKEREKYLRRVRKHTEALLMLLRDTQYDRYGFGKEVDLEKLPKRILQDLGPWGDDYDEDPGHVVAYWVSSEGVRHMPWDYPESHLVEHLQQVEQWTHEEDYWDGFHSSATIGHAKGKNVPIIYFNCSLHARLKSDGLNIPFTLLADVANVVFQLSAEDAVDEETVRKQVRRCEARRDKVRKVKHAKESDREIPF